MCAVVLSETPELSRILDARKARSINKVSDDHQRECALFCECSFIADLDLLSLMRVVYLAIMQGIKPSSIRASRRSADHACTSTDTNIDHILILHPPAHLRSQIIGIRFITAWTQKFFEAWWDVVNTRKPEISAPSKILR